MTSKLRFVLLLSAAPFLLGVQCQHTKEQNKADPVLTCRVIGPLALHDLTDEEVDHLLEKTQDIIADQKVYWTRRCT